VDYNTDSAYAMDQRRLELHARRGRWRRAYYRGEQRDKALRIIGKITAELSELEAAYTRRFLDE